MIKALDIDSLYNAEPYIFNSASSYFDNINDEPNYNIFELFLSLTKKVRHKSDLYYSTQIKIL